MAQGYIIDNVADTITFLEPVASTQTVVVTETASGDVNSTDVWAYGAWGGIWGYPGEVEFYGDRLMYAGSRQQPQTIWASKTSAYVDFGRSVPLADDDAFALTINARQINAIKELVPLADLIIMTASGEWKLTTGADQVIAPGKVGFKPQSYYGTNGLPVPVVGSTAVFVQSRGNIVRDMSYAFADDGYKGNDLTIYASHLVEGFTVVDVAFQQSPYSCVWLVRSDGKLISLTYVREQEVVGWALHTTDGKFESVCCVPDGDENALFASIRRTINGVERVSLEKLHPRDFEDDQRKAFFVDSGLTFDGQNRPGTMTLTSTHAYDPDQAMVLTASVATFVGASDVGDIVRLVIPATYDANGDLATEEQSHRVIILGYTSPTIVAARSIGDVPAAFRGVAFASGRWEIQRDSMSGLQHLEGKTVSVLADGAVQAQKVVASGAITLDRPAAVVHVGLPYRSLIESLDINVPGQQTVRDDVKILKRVSLLVKHTRGLLSGPDLDHLDEFKVREFEDYDEPLALWSGILSVNTSSSWDRNGRFVAVQEDPLPATILSLIPDVDFGRTL